MLAKHLVLYKLFIFRLLLLLIFLFLSAPSFYKDFFLCKRDLGGVNP